MLSTVLVSDAPPEEVKERKYDKFDASTFKTDAEKRDELVCGALYARSLTPVILVRLFGDTW